MRPKMADPAPRPSSRRRRAAKAKGRRAKRSLLVKTCLLFQKRSPPQCHWPGRNHMASSSCKGNQVFSLQLTQYGEAMTKGRVVSAALYLWGLGFLSLLVACLPQTFLSEDWLCIFKHKRGNGHPSPGTASRLSAPAPLMTCVSSQSPTSKPQRQRC